MLSKNQTGSHRVVSLRIMVRKLLNCNKNYDKDAMDGWPICNFISFSTVFKKYQDKMEGDKGRLYAMTKENADSSRT